MEKDIPSQRVWYKKKRYIIPLAVLGVVFLRGSDNSSSQIKSEPIVAPYIAPVYQPSSSANLDKVLFKTETTSAKTDTLSNDNYYTNVSGNKVHSPAYSNSVPAGASARCRDGTYSFSQHRSGTCSHHGGVAEWL